MPGVLDLSLVTDRLIDQLEACRDATELWAEASSPGDPAVPAAHISVTGLPPDLARKSGSTQLSLYLFHVAPDRFHRNTFPVVNYHHHQPNKDDPGRALPQTVPQQPLALTLYYLLSAHSQNYIEEQQAMSIALKCFHEHPFIEATVPSDGRIERFTLTLEPESLDEIGRIWQSASAPMRLSAVYRASVVFLEPESVESEPKPVLHVPAVDALIADAITEVRLLPGPLDLHRARAVGFVLGASVVKLDNTFLIAAAANALPGPGEYAVVTPARLDFRPPAGTAAGRHRLQVWFTPGQPRPTEAWVVLP